MKMTTNGSNLVSKGGKMAETTARKRTVATMLPFSTFDLMQLVSFIVAILVAYFIAGEKL